MATRHVAAETLLLYVHIRIKRMYTTIDFLMLFYILLKVCSNKPLRMCHKKKNCMRPLLKNKTNHSIGSATRNVKFITFACLF